MVAHSSILAWRIPGIGEPGGLPPMGSHRVRHDWSDLAAVTAARNQKTWQSSTFLEPSLEVMMHKSDGFWNHVLYGTLRETLFLSSLLVNFPTPCPSPKDFPTEKSFPFSLPTQSLFSSLLHYYRNILTILSVPQFAFLPTHTPSTTIPPSLLEVILTSSKMSLLVPLVWILCELLGIIPAHPFHMVLALFTWYSYCECLCSPSD